MPAFKLGIGRNVQNSIMISSCPKARGGNYEEESNAEDNVDHERGRGFFDPCETLLSTLYFTELVSAIGSQGVPVTSLRP